MSRKIENTTKSRRTKGTGSLRKITLANGETKWKGTVVCGHSTDGKVKRKTFTGKLQKDVQMKMNKCYDEYHAKKQEQDALSPDATDTQTFEKYAIEWLFTKRYGELKETTIARYEGIITKFIEGSRLGKFKMNDITRESLREHYELLLDEYIGRESKRIKNPNSYIKNIHKVINSVLAEAASEGMILQNPASRMRLPKAIFQTKEERLLYFKETEQKAFLQVASTSRYYALFLMAFRTGLRQGELLGLRWSDIDFENNYVTVNRTVKSISVLDKNRKKTYKTIELPPKTLSSQRRVPLTPEVIRELKSYATKQEQEREAYKEIYFDKGDFVFTTKLGLMIDARNLTRAYTRLLKSTGIPHKGFHSIRHSYATRLFERGVAPKKVQKLMGHKDITTTMNIYTHINSEDLHDDVALLDD